MLRIILAAAALAAAPSLVRAADAPPELQALGRMTQECQGREAGALVQVYALQAQLAAQTKRADEAEAKLKANEPTADAAPTSK